MPHTRSSLDRLHPSQVSDGCELERDITFNWFVAGVAVLIAVPVFLVAAPALWVKGHWNRSTRGGP